MVEVVNDLRISRRVDRKRWTMRQRDVQNNCNGQLSNRRANTVEPLLYDHPQNHIDVVV